MIFPFSRVRRNVTRIAYNAREKVNAIATNGAFCFVAWNHYRSAVLEDLVIQLMDADDVIHIHIRLV